MPVVAIQKPARVAPALITFVAPEYPTYWARYDLHGVVTLSLVTGPGGTITSTSIEDVQFAEKPADPEAAKREMLAAVEAVRAKWRVSARITPGTKFSRTIKFVLPPAAPGDRFSLRCNVEKTTTRFLPGTRPDAFPFRFDSYDTKVERYITVISIDLSSKKYLKDGMKAAWAIERVEPTTIVLMDIGNPQQDFRIYERLNRENGKYYRTEKYSNSKDSIFDEGTCEKSPFVPFPKPPLPPTVKF